MKFFFIILLAAVSCCFVHAQNVGIGTNAPNSKALLDISSTTKGILLPRMTTSQRFGITTPPNGLVVYDTDKNEFYHHDGVGWKALLNSDYWSRPITSRKRIANSIDSVGIGTSSPTEWLDVDGNIRSRNNVLADNAITAQGSITGGALATGGNMVVVGTSVLSGDVTTNSDVIINNTTATMQLKSSAVNKGYFQLSGNNVRTGTNSGNTDGRFIIRNNGADRIAVEADGKLTTPATGDNNSLIPLCYGVVSEDAGLLRGTSNVTVERVGTPSTENAYWRISCAGITATSIILVTPDIAYNDQAKAKCYLLGTARVYLKDPEDGSTSYYHSGFYFIIYK